MLGDDDFNIWDDMDEDVKRIFFDSYPKATSVEHILLKNIQYVYM